MRSILLLFLFAAMLTEWDGEKDTRSNAEWRQDLGEERYQIMRGKKTERAFVGKYVYLFGGTGLYCCAACHLPLFLQQDQYDAHSGYPCFTKPVATKNVYYEEDWTLPFKRYEVLCRKCDSHLGHVFPDGPPPQKRRYCINSLALELQE